MRPGSKAGSFSLSEKVKKTSQRIIRFPALSASCRVLSGRGILGEMPPFLERIDRGGFFLLLTDRNVNKLYGDDLHRMLVKRGYKCLKLVITPGEKSKSRRMKEKIEDFMFQNHCGRDTVVLSIGGGVIGDIGGFVASTFMRGIPHIQIPTTMLSMVDSSIGGKTAVNHPLGKNMIGTFHQPFAVIIDVETLQTLSQREYRCGIAESIKYGAVLDESLFSMMEKKRRMIESRHPDILLKVVRRCVRLKSLVVQRDERESGIRKVLNFGHTIAHAVEILSSFRIPHGEAVAIGMAVESEISRSLGYLSEDEQRRLTELFTAFALPVRIPHRFTPEEIVSFTKRDKKVRKGKVEYTLIGGIGSLADEKRITIQVNDGIALKVLRRCIR